MSRYVIYGAGAIGGAIGASLFQAGHEVVLIARGAHLRAILDEGLRFETPDATSTLTIPAVDHPSKIEFRREDIVMIAVKSQDTAEVLRALEATMPHEIPVVCVQNGIDNERSALRIFANVYGVMIISPATHLSPGIVTVNSTNLGVIELGRYPEGEDLRAVELAGTFNACGWFAECSRAIQDWKYAKLIENLSNVTQIVLGLDSREGEVARIAKQEGIECLRGAGISFIDPAELSRLRLEHSTLAPAGGGPRAGTSTWQSLARGTGAVETDYLNGEIVLIGRLHGISTPVNELLQRLANQIAREKNAPASMTDEEFLRQMLS